MADDKSFKELITESKRTNKLLEQQMASEDKGSKLGASIKNAAGEIINDRLISRTAKREADETQAAIKKSAADTLEQSEEYNKESLSVWSRIANNLTGAFVGKSGGKGSAAEKEAAKDEENRATALFKKYLGKDSTVGKRLLGIFDSFKGFAKSIIGKGKGILGVLLGVAGYGLLLRYLNSPEFKAFIESGDAGKKIAAAAKAVFGEGGFLDKIVTFVGDFLPNILWGKNRGGTIDEPKGASVFGILGGAAKLIGENLIIAFDSEEPLWKRILAGLKVLFVTTAPLLVAGAVTAIGLVAPALIWTLSGIGLSAVFSTTGLIVAAALVALVPAFKFLMKRKAEAEARGEEYDGYIGDLVGSIFGGGMNVLNIVFAELLDALTLGVFNFSGTARETDYRVLFSDLYTDLGTFLYNMVAGAVNFVRKLIFGKDEEDLKADVAKTEEKIQKNLAAQDRILSKGENMTTFDKERLEGLMNQYNDLTKIKKIQEGKVSDFDPNAPRGIVPGNMTKIVGDQSLLKFKETGDIADFKSIETGTAARDARELVKSVLKEGGNIQDLYYNEEGRLSMPTAVTPPPLVTQVNNNNQNTTHQNQVNVSNLAVNAAQIFGR